MVQDSVFEGYGRAVKIGAGSKAEVIAPSEGVFAGCLVRFHRIWNGYKLVVPARAAVDKIEFAGEDSLGPTQIAAGFTRELHLGTGGGRLHIGSAEIDFELIPLHVTDRPRNPIPLAREYPSCRKDGIGPGLAVGMAGAAMVALVFAFSIALVRQWGDGKTARWGEMTPQGADQARYLRVTMEPNAAGASRRAAAPASPPAASPPAS